MRVLNRICSKCNIITPRRFNCLNCGEPFEPFDKLKMRLKCQKIRQKTEQRRKIRLKLKEVKEKLENLFNTSPKIKECLTCKQKFFSNDHRVYCSKECASENRYVKI